MADLLNQLLKRDALPLAQAARAGALESGCARGRARFGAPGIAEPRAHTTWRGLARPLSPPSVRRTPRRWARWARQAGPWRAGCCGINTRAVLADKKGFQVLLFLKPFLSAVEAIGVVGPGALHRIAGRGRGTAGGPVARSQSAAGGGAAQNRAGCGGVRRRFWGRAACAPRPCGFGSVRALCR